MSKPRHYRSPNYVPPMGLEEGPVMVNDIQKEIAIEMLFNVGQKEEGQEDKWDYENFLHEGPNCYKGGPLKDKNYMAKGLKPGR